MALKVYMVKVSYHQKPYRKSFMNMFGAEVIPSPSKFTNAGRAELERDPSSNGSLGLAISEAVEDAIMNKDTNYALGSVLNHVILHQSLIGLEAKKNRWRSAAIILIWYSLPAAEVQTSVESHRHL